MCVCVRRSQQKLSARCFVVALAILNQNIRLKLKPCYFLFTFFLSVDTFNSFSAPTRQRSTSRWLSKTTPNKNTKNIQIIIMLSKRKYIHKESEKNTEFFSYSKFILGTNFIRYILLAYRQNHGQNFIYLSTKLFIFLCLFSVHMFHFGFVMDFLVGFFKYLWTLHSTIFWMKSYFFVENCTLYSFQGEEI